MRVRARMCSLSELLRHAWTIELMLSKNGHMHIEANIRRYIVCRGMEAMISIWYIFLLIHNSCVCVRKIRIGRLSCYAMRIYFVSISSSCWCSPFFQQHSFIHSFIQAIQWIVYILGILTNKCDRGCAHAQCRVLCVRISWKWKRAFVQSNLLRCE